MYCDTRVDNESTDSCNIFYEEDFIAVCIYTKMSMLMYSYVVIM